MSDYKLELEHHGILGQKWGVRRFQNADGTRTAVGRKRYRAQNTVGLNTTKFNTNDGVIKRGTKVYRVSMHENDPVFDNKRYVSLNKKDNKKWAAYFDKGYGSSADLYQLKYKIVKDIRVASETELGKSFVNQLKKDPKYTVMQTKAADSFLRTRVSSQNVSMEEAAARNVAAQTELGRRLVNDLMSKGYDAMPDTHGTNISDNPVIVFNPDDKMKRVSSKPLKRKYK